MHLRVRLNIGHIMSMHPRPTRPFVREPTPGRMVNVVAPMVLPAPATTNNAAVDPPPAIVVPTAAKMMIGRTVVAELLKQQQQQQSQPQLPPQHPKLASSFFAADKAEEWGGRGEARQKRDHLGSDGSSVSENSSVSASADNSSVSDNSSSSCSSSDNESLRGSPPPPQAGWNIYPANINIYFAVHLHYGYF